MVKMTFVDRDGHEIDVEAEAGLTVMEVATRAGIDIEAACEGSLACATCHLVVAKDWFHKLTAASEEEEDMLDLAAGLTETSRLSCQIPVTDALDGISFSLPDDV